MKSVSCPNEAQNAKVDQQITEGQTSHMEYLLTNPDLSKCILNLPNLSKPIRIYPTLSNLIPS